jgi:hypothetical protein
MGGGGAGVGCGVVIVLSAVTLPTLHKWWVI